MSVEASWPIRECTYRDQEHRWGVLTAQFHTQSHKPDTRRARVRDMAEPAFHLVTCLPDADHKKWHTKRRVGAEKRSGMRLHHTLVHDHRMTNDTTAKNERRTRQMGEQRLRLRGESSVKHDVARDQHEHDTGMKLHDARVNSLNALRGEREGRD